MGEKRKLHIILIISVAIIGIVALVTLIITQKEGKEQGILGDPPSQNESSGRLILGADLSDLSVEDGAYIDIEGCSSKIEQSGNGLDHEAY